MFVCMLYVGATDITADVDFSALRRTIRGELESKLTVIGPTTQVINIGTHIPRAFPCLKCFILFQASFLLHMGALQRIMKLIDLSTTSNEKASALYDQFEFLVGKEAMGRKFKVLAIASNNKILEKDKIKETNVVSY